MLRFDAVSLLIRDHATICHLLECLRTTPPAERQDYVASLQAVTSQYLDAEAKVRSAAGKGHRSGARAADVLHASFRLVNACGGPDRTFRRAVDHLMDAVAAHADEQERDLFPHLSERLSRRRLRLIGNEIERSRGYAVDVSAPSRADSVA